MGKRMAIDRRRAILAGVAAPFIFPGAARAQGFPNRQITWVVPGGPGSVLDIGARVIAQKMAGSLGQTVVIDNRPGAGGTVAAEAVLRQPPDGHTLFYGNFATFAIAPLLIPNIGYDARRDFQPVNGVGASANIAVCAPNRPYRTLRELVAHAKANPEQVTFAAGVGSGQHAAAALFAHVAQVKLTMVPYNNFSQALNDVAAGRVDLYFDYPLSSLPYVRDGKLRALAVNADQRLAIAPEIPTVAEAGVPGAELLGWAGIYVPSAVPEPVARKLAVAAVAALETPEVRHLFDSTGTILWPHMDAAKMRHVLEEEIPRMRELIGRTGAAD
jgi:tripartite-type tricarboxylate transporter receptor subunit TctC